MMQSTISRTAFAAKLLAGALGVASIVSIAASAQVTPAPQPGVWVLQTQGPCSLGQTGPNQTIVGTKYALVSTGMIRTWCSKDPVRLCDARTGVTASGSQPCPPGSSTLVTPKPIDQTPIPPKPPLSEEELQLAALKNAIAEARAANPDGEALSPFQITEQVGTISLVLPNGKQVDIKNGVGVIFDDGERSVGALPRGAELRSGAGGGAVMLFSDNTVLSLQSQSRLKLNDFNFNADDSSGSSFFSMLQGVFVYTSGLIGKNDPGNVRVESGTGCCGIRGTRFESTVNKDKSGQVKVFDGEVEVRPPNGDALVVVKRGQMVTISSKGKVSRPQKF